MIQHDESFVNSINETLLEITLNLNFINYTQYLFIKNSLKKASKSTISLLLENNYITENQKYLILKNYLEEHQFSKDDIRFGALAHKLFNISFEDIRSALSYQKQVKKFIPLRLGEILVLHNKLTPKQVMEIMNLQDSKVVSCQCGTSYNLFKFIKGKNITCYKCSKKIVVPV